MDKGKATVSNLIATSSIELRDELDEKLDRCYSIVLGLTAGVSEREANDALNAYVCRGSTQHEEVQNGLLCAILTDANTAAKSYRDMTLISRDGLTSVLTRTNQLVFEKWLKLTDTTRTQILWLSRELVRNAVAGADSVCHSLTRQIAGGDITSKNIWLTENLLDILTENRTWLDKFPMLQATTVYTYLRVIVDHGNSSFAVLRQRESELCVSILREKWSDCATIGRDLVRLLQNVARIPEFEKLWQDLWLNPSALSPQFTGVLQLLQMRTSRKFLVSRLTPDMETKLVFLTTKVKFGQQKRYQDWFQRQYLSTPESQSLRCDLIRYICAVFHPPNELLCSDIIPRWAVIGWLLTTCTSNVAASNAKLSLFYDWLFFQQDKDSIMNIEPAILVMYHSMRPHPAITATLLDFMCRIMSNFSPQLSVQVRQGVFTSLKVILDKRVLQSLSPLFDNSKLDKELRNLLRETFAEFCSSSECIVKDELPGVVGVGGVGGGGGKESVSEIENNNHVMDAMNSLSDAAFSDDEDENPLTIGQIKEEIKFKPIQQIVYQPVDITDNLTELGIDIRDLAEQLQEETDPANQCEIMDRLIQTVVTDEEFDEDTCLHLSICLCQILSSQFNNNLFPQDVDDEFILKDECLFLFWRSIEDSIGAPLFVMFRNLVSMSEEDSNRPPLLQLLGEMYVKQPRIGYHLLYFLKVCRGNDDKMLTYKDFCKSVDNKDVGSCLMADLKLCQEDDVRLFTFLLPDIYTQFPNIAVGNSDLLNIIVSCIDGTQLQDLICQILQGHLVMFRKESFLAVLNASLDWETLEQYFLWQLIAAHNIPIEYVMPILPRLEFSGHAEALTSILVLLKQENPSVDLLRPVLCRDCRKQDLFTVSILKYWAQEYEDKLADHIYSLLTKSHNTPKKRQRGTVIKKDQPSTDNVLAHLDHMRQVCRNVSFLNHEQVQHALQQVQMAASEVQKTKYSDLLALVEDFDDIKTTRVLRGRKASHPGPKTQSRTKKSPADDSAGESYSDSSEDGEAKHKAKKRKKGLVLLDDDSD